MENAAPRFRLNVGRPDRTARVVGGLVLLALALFAVGGFWAILFGLVGLVLIVTGAVGFCPLYRVLGLSTCRTG